MFTKIDHVEIVPSNFEKSFDFYTNILGFKLLWRRKADNPPLEEVVFINLGDITIEMFRVNKPAPGSKERWHVGMGKIALAVDDFEKTLAYLKTKGVEPAQPPTANEAMKRTIINDPDGLQIEVVQRLK